MNIKVNTDVSSVFREIVYVRHNQRQCDCSTLLCDPHSAVNLETKMYDVCATCGGLVPNDFDDTDEARERDEWQEEAYMHDNEPGELVYE